MSENGDAIDGSEAQTTRLIEILRGSISLDEKEAAIRRIGEEISAASGMMAMQNVYYDVYDRFPSGGEENGGWHPRLIDVAWDGVGG